MRSITDWQSTNIASQPSTREATYLARTNAMYSSGKAQSVAPSKSGMYSAGKESPKGSPGAGTATRPAPATYCPGSRKRCSEGVRFQSAEP
jgi:hypothetical protein